MTSRTFKSRIGQLHADAASPATRELLALMHGNFGVDQSAIAGMNDMQLLRVADACRFLFNNLPPSNAQRVSISSSVNDTDTIGIQR